MKLETTDVMIRFGIEKAEYKRRLAESFSFLIGKYFGLKGKAERSKDRYFGLIDDVKCDDDTNKVTGEYFMRLTITYKNSKGEMKDTAVIFEDNSFFTSRNRVLVYGDDEDSVKLELVCTEK